MTTLDEVITVLNESSMKNSKKQWLIDHCTKCPEDLKNFLIVNNDELREENLSSIFEDNIYITYEVIAASDTHTIYYRWKRLGYKPKED